MSLVLDSGEPNISPPLCPHGPTLLFRKVSDGALRKRPKSKTPNKLYYACSASRDIKFCSFYCERDQWIKDCSKILGKPKKFNDSTNYQYLLNNTQSRLGFCHDCCRVIVDEKFNICKQHKLNFHSNCNNVDYNVDCANYFRLPTKLLQAETQNKNQAQYFFSENIIESILKYVVDLFRFDKIICIGCPTIHEQILCGRKNVDSILLDIDQRFEQFYPPTQFILFNMFNGHFFNQDGDKRLREFIKQSDKVLLLIDPPFGGLVECLSRTIEKFCSTYFQNILPSTILFFPYFNEHWITRAFKQQLKITDFIVTYLNHGKFRSKSDKPECSPVRIFTNISQIEFNFIDSNQKLYRWCNVCRRVVFKTNKHCNVCCACTARDATKAYHHCVDCGVCVKSSWSHCVKCFQCHLTGTGCREQSIDSAKRFKTK